MGDVAGVLVRRVATGLLTLLLLATVVFFGVRLVGDPATVLAGPEALPSQIHAIEADLGLDKPMLQQYFDFLGGLVQGDVGDSWTTDRPAAQMVLERFPNTLMLAVIAMVLAAVIAVPIGVIAAVRPGSAIDTYSRFIAVLGQSMPVFWLGILMVLLFSVHLHWFPAGGADTWQSLVLPGVALSVYSIPLTMRLTRSAMLEVLHQDYVRTARSKGLSERRVILMHAFRNALIPVITVLTLRIGHVIGGAVTLELVFAYPGVGTVAIDAMLHRDFPIIQFFVLFIALLIILVNLLADVLYTVVDPRIKLS